MSACSAELQEKNQALTVAYGQVTEALDQQTATSEILRVISSSPTDLQPVFETILARAVRLCGAEYANLFRFDGERQHFVTGYNTPAAMREAHSRQYPMVPARGRMSGRAILERRIVHVPDLLAEPEYQRSTAVVGGFPEQPCGADDAGGGADRGDRDQPDRARPLSPTMQILTS